MDSLRQLALERIRFFETRLREEYGILFRMHAELEFFPLDATGSARPGLIDADAVRKAFADSPYIENIRVEPGSGAQLEITTGAGMGVAGEPHDFRRTSGETAARVIDGIRRTLKRRAREWGVADASFAAQAFPDHTFETSGLHLNISLCDTDGRNLFYERGRKHSDLERHVIDALLKVQSEGALGFIQTDNGFDRLDVTNRRLTSLGELQQLPRSQVITRLLGATPEHIAHIDNKSATLSGIKSNIVQLMRTGSLQAGSLSSRYPSLGARMLSAGRVGSESASQCRLENRLPGADIEPYTATALTLAAVYDAVRQHARLIETTGLLKKASRPVLAVDRHEGAFPTLPLAKTRQEATELFEHSAYLRDLLGTELHRAIRDRYGCETQYPHTAPAATPARFTAKTPQRPLAPESEHIRQRTGHGRSTGAEA